MKLSQFKFDLPHSLIAMQPKEQRDGARMMVIDRATGKIEHKMFTDIVDYFDDGDIMVTNNTRVFPARLYGSKEKTGAKIEVFLLRELNREMRLWDVLVDPARKIRVGNKLYFGESDLVAEVIDNTTSRGRTIRFLFDGDHEEMMSTIHELGETPIPKEIITREVTDLDRERFQTIFATEEGAVSAPTAGMHFTKNIMRKMQIKGVEFSPITLHIGIGTFRGVEVEDLTKHKTDSENFTIKQSTCDAVNNALDNGKRVCAIGTTSLKTLESSVSANLRLKAIDNSWTDKFLFPPYDFKIGNALLTNLHLPQSIVLMSACAFGGYELIMDAYQEAIKEKYEFFTYGDSMLIL
ncbi:tRNA preQ1(34) S-adenosylmethionine ribosyltransferase-isomerase QueA [Jiulongibacter sp. NS-SX5]|uniref:tRNA preQ1(34) S-adenosylmethionine ribosyltransferase-isomerase QueA n=1 Tax=Jiulongibacter sp. NS-SX5 TaxID=3463854 RepID=UPI00405A10A5